MTWLKRILIFLALLLTIAVLLPFFIKLNDYIPQLEQAISSKVNVPVSIKNISFATLPTPHVTLEGISIDTDIKLNKVIITPDLWSLLQTVIIIKRIEIDSPILTQKAIDTILALSHKDDASANAPQKALLKNVQISNALINLDKVKFGPFDASASLDNQGQLKEALISTTDGALKVLIKPDQANYLIEARAQQWALPVEPKILLDELSIKAVASSENIQFDQINAKLYSGTADGKVNLSWKNGFKLNGHFALNQIETQTIAGMLSPNTRVSGKLTAKPVFSASAATAEQLIRHLQLATPFSVKNGVLYGVDIQQAASKLIKKNTGGGETHFDQLSGQLNMVHGGYHFTQLKIASGTLAVDGKVSISPKKDLSGRINAEIKAVGVSSKIPLNVTGTLDSPLLLPTGATIAGAAVGTAIMGPGMGTSVGAKVGGWVDNLFSGQENKKTK